LVAWRGPQTFQDFDATGHVIAIHNDGIELFRDQNLVAFFRLLADFNFDGKFFEASA